MKKLLLIAVLFSIGFAAMAQKGGQRGSATPEERAERITNKMAEELSLSEDQKKRVYQINLDHAKKRQAEMEARRAAMEADMKAQNQEIEALLSEEQKAKWAEMKAEGKKRMEEEGRGRRGGPGRGHRSGGSTN
jgi:periplasmic protein CpxP/Spy